MAWRHGTRYGYDAHRCRCDACRNAKYAARRASRARAREARSPGYLRELAVMQALKEGYRGTCTSCGATTTGCYGPGLAPDLCFACSARRVAKQRRGTGPITENALAFISGGERRRRDICDHLGISSAHASNLMNRLVGYGLVERVSRGRYRLTSPTPMVEKASCA